MRAMALAVAVAVLGACGGEDEAETLPATEVAYSVNGAVLECPGAAWSWEWTNVHDGTGDRMITCGWFCATYEGEESNEILLGFRFDEDAQTWTREDIVGRQSASPCP